MDVGICFRSASLGSSLDGVVAALNGRKVDVDIGGRRGRNGLVGPVEEDRDWRLEDA